MKRNVLMYAAWLELTHNNASDMIALEKLEIYQLPKLRYYYVAK